MIDLRSEPETRLAIKTFITALTLMLALASGISMIATAFHADFRELAADHGGDRTTLEPSRPNSE
jgi:hypothetical protein